MRFVSKRLCFLRYSGLRIRDAVTVPRNRVQGDNRHTGVLPIATCRDECAECNSRQHVLFLDRNFEAKKCSGRLAKQS
jgi:hypothetical protein